MKYKKLQKLIKSNCYSHFWPNGLFSHRRFRARYRSSKYSRDVWSSI